MLNFVYLQIRIYYEEHNLSNVFLKAIENKLYRMYFDPDILNNLYAIFF